MCVPDRGNEAGAPAPFHEKADGAGLPRGPNDAATPVRTEHEHVDAGSLPGEDPRGVDSGHVRHGHVHEDDVRVQPRREVEGIPTVGGLPDDRDPAGLTEQVDQRSTDTRMIVDDENPDRRGCGRPALAPDCASGARRRTSSRGPQRTEDELAYRRHRERHHWKDSSPA